MNTKKLLLLLFLGVATVSCGSTWEVASASYQSGPCTVSQYEYGLYGWGFYDCYGRPVGAGFYSNYYRNVGPRIIIKPRRPVRPQSPRAVRSTTRRGSGGGRTERATAAQKQIKQEIPKYNGWCAYALAKGELVPSDPDIYLIEDGEKIYFYDRWTRFLYKRWKGAQELAEGYWEELKEEGLKESGLQR